MDQVSRAVVRWRETPWPAGPPAAVGAASLGSRRYPVQDPGWDTILSLGCPGAAVIDVPL